MTDCRTEKDFLGALDVPRDAYWGIHTERARRNFRISSLTVHPELIRALAVVKQACCLANAEAGGLPSEKAAAIGRAAREIAAGGLFDQFPLDALQGGAGTSTNMNLNEVIANRAIELLGGAKGDYAIVSPLDDVNRHQSTNDVYPTALRIAAIRRLRSLAELQDAVPITLGAEFSAFAEAVGRDRWRTFKCEERLRVVNLGGTAVGTGLAAPRDYIFLVVEKLRELTGLGLSRGENLMGETANADAFVEVSGILKAHAVNLIKIAGDLRQMNFLGEIHLPRLQAGSSIMPGKVNPVGTEAAIQAGVKVIANDAIVAEAAALGTFQINEFLPLLACALLESLDLLAGIDKLLAGQVKQLSADPQRCGEFVDKSPAIITALLPAVGYERAAALAAEFSAGQEKNMRTFLIQKLGADLVERCLSPFALTALGYRDRG